MELFDIQLSGTKEQARKQVGEQMKQPSELRDAIITIINEAPGTCLSMSGTLTGTADGSHGCISLSGSFWTEAKKS